MRRAVLMSLAGFLVVAASAAQTIQPKTIEFTGAPDYTPQELLDAAGLKLGMTLDSAAINDHAKLLMATGLFDNLSYKTEGDDLTFQLTPAVQLLPIRLGNLPLTPGNDLDAQLHARCPLYHGKVPAQGGLTNDVGKALEAILAAGKIKATVSATPFTEGQAVVAVMFNISAPPVVVGDLHEEPGSNFLDAGAQRILSLETGSPFDREASQTKVEADLGRYYLDQGYLEAEIHARPHFPATAAAADIRVPFTLSLSTGPLYRIAAIQLAPDLVVAQAEFDRQSHIRPGDPADATLLRESWEFIAGQYHDRGMMKARVIPTASFDRANNSVSYLVTVEPGPVYTMGKLAIENVADDLAATMVKEWQIPPGSVFNEGAVKAFFADGNMNPELARVFAAARCTYSLSLNDENRTVNVVLRLENKQGK